MLIRFKINDGDIKLALRTARVPDTPWTLEAIRQYLTTECILMMESFLFGENTDWHYIHEECLSDIRLTRRTRPRSEPARPSQRDRSSESNETICFDGQRMQELRRRQGLSAKILAYQADVDVRHVYRLEGGERPNVSAVVLARIAIALGTTLEYLLGLTDDCQTTRIL
jgi:hypothetical protein